ncbi:MAG: carboxypeptidase-like regulatory domain-containing protein, partial [Bacteroidales bacterium]|nr:carboxypeptidase-like regulatory domain-containing protein [Bacteroidales bacterium]
MKFLSGLCVVLVFLPVAAFSQTLHTLTGQVTDENNLPLPGANVYLTPIRKGTGTDRKGNFEIRGLPAGKYTVEISFLGYKKFSDTIDVRNVHNLSVQLKSLPQTLNEVIVTGHHAEFRKKEESLNIEIVNNDYLKQNLGGSLMQSLERLPGFNHRHR